MRPVYTKLILQNGDDASDFRRNKIGRDDLREIEIEAIVDNGSILLCINEDVREALGLDIIDYRPSRLVDNTKLKLPVAGPVVVRFLDRFCITDASGIAGR